MSAGGYGRRVVVAVKVTVKRAVVTKRAEAAELARKTHSLFDQIPRCCHSCLLLCFSVSFFLQKKRNCFNSRA